MSKIAHMITNLLPCVGLPDAQMLFAYSWPLTPLGRVFNQQCWKGVARSHGVMRLVRHVVLYGRLPVWQEIFDFDSQGGCSLISGLFAQTPSLLTLMEFAEKALVS